MSTDSDDRAQHGSSEDAESLVALATSRLQEALEFLRAAEETAGRAAAKGAELDDDKHPHEPPTLISSGSFIVECDEPLDAVGDGGVMDPVTGKKRKKHKRQTPDGEPDPRIACVIIEGGTQMSARRFKFNAGDCKIKIYWDGHACDDH